MKVNGNVGVMTLNLYYMSIFFWGGKRSKLFLRFFTMTCFISIIIKEVGSAI